MPSIATTVTTTTPSKMSAVLSSHDHLGILLLSIVSRSMADNATDTTTTANATDTAAEDNTTPFTSGEDRSLPIPISPLTFKRSEQGAASEAESPWSLFHYILFGVGGGCILLIVSALLIGGIKSRRRLHGSISRQHDGPSASKERESVAKESSVKSAGHVSTRSSKAGDSFNIIDLEEGKKGRGTAGEDEFVDDDEWIIQPKATEDYSVRINDTATFAAEGDNEQFEMILDTLKEGGEAIPNAAGCRGVDVMGRALAAFGVITGQPSTISATNGADDKAIILSKLSMQTDTGKIIEPMPECEVNSVVSEEVVDDAVDELEKRENGKKKKKKWFNKNKQAQTDEPVTASKGDIFSINAVMDRDEEEELHHPIAEDSSPNEPNEESRKSKKAITAFFRSEKKVKGIPPFCKSKKKAGANNTMDAAVPNVEEKEHEEGADTGIVNETNEDHQDDAKSTVPSKSNTSNDLTLSRTSVQPPLEEKERSSRFQHFLNNLDNQSTFSATTGTRTMRTAGDDDDGSTIASRSMAGPPDLQIEASDSDATQPISNVLNNLFGEKNNKVDSDNDDDSVSAYSAYSAYSHREVHNEKEEGIVLPRKVRRIPKLQSIDEETYTSTVDTTDIVDDLNLTQTDSSTLSILKAIPEDAPTMTSSLKRETKKTYSNFMDILLHDPRRKKAAAREDDESTAGSSVISHIELHSADEVGIVPNIVPVGSFNVKNDSSVGKDKVTNKPVPDDEANNNEVARVGNEINHEDEQDDTIHESSQTCTDGSTLAAAASASPSPRGQETEEKNLMAKTRSLPVSPTSQGEETKEKKKILAKTRSLFAKTKAAPPANVTDSSSDHNTEASSVYSASTAGRFTHLEYNGSKEQGIVHRAMLQGDGVDHMMDDGNTEYSALTAMTGLTGRNSTYNGGDRPPRAKTYARFLGMGDDMSTFSDNTGMSMGQSVMSGKSLKQRDQTGISYMTGATGTTGGVTQCTGMSSINPKQQRSGISYMTQRSEMSSRCRTSSDATPDSQAFSDASPYSDTEASRHAQDPSKDSDAVDTGHLSLAAALGAVPGREGAASRSIPRDSTGARLARAAAPLLLDDQSTFSARSNSSVTTATNSIRTFASKASHHELHSRGEEGIVHKSVLKTPPAANAGSKLGPVVSSRASTRSSGSAANSSAKSMAHSVASTFPQRSSYEIQQDDEASQSSGVTARSAITTVETTEFNRTPLEDKLGAIKANDDNSTGKDSCNGSTTSKSTKANSVNSTQSTALIMNRAPPMSNADKHMVSLIEKKIYRPKIPCIDSMTTYSGSYVNEWHDLDSFYGESATIGDGDSFTAYTYNDNETAYTGSIAVNRLAKEYAQIRIAQSQGLQKKDATEENVSSSSGLNPSKEQKQLLSPTGGRATRIIKRQGLSRSKKK